MALKRFCSLLLCCVSVSLPCWEQQPSFTAVSMDFNSSNKMGFGTVLVAEKRYCKACMIPARDHCFTLSPDFTRVFFTISIDKDKNVKMKHDSHLHCWPACSVLGWSEKFQGTFWYILTGLLLLWLWVTIGIHCIRYEVMLRRSKTFQVCWQWTLILNFGCRWIIT